jgi:hypothetical protein
VKFGVFAIPGFRCKSLIISLSLRDIVSVIHYDVTICMKLDPGIHIGSTWYSLENRVRQNRKLLPHQGGEVRSPHPAFRASPQDKEEELQREDARAQGLQR